MDETAVRRRLTALLEKTISARALSSDVDKWWNDDTRDDRARRRDIDNWWGDAPVDAVAARDDGIAGRLHWVEAHREAQAGMDALKAGNVDLARSLAWSATDFYIAALETRLSPSNLAVLGKETKPRGRPSNPQK